MNPPGSLATRFVLDNDGQWIAMQINASEESLRDRESTAYEQAVVVVPNSLSAAAPELFEALKPFANYACDEPHVDEPQCHNCIARAAIAKAKGDAS